MAKKQEDNNKPETAPNAPDTRQSSTVAGRGAVSAAASRKNANKPAKQSNSKRAQKKERKENFEKAVAKSAEKIKKKKEAAKAKAPAQKVEEPVNPKVTRPTADEQLDIIERQNLVWQLRKKRAPFRLISQRLTQIGYKASLGQVYDDYKYMLSLSIKEQEQTVKEDTAELCEILNDVIFSFSPQLDKPINSDWQRKAKKDAGTLIVDSVKEIANLKNLKKQPEIKVDIDVLLSELSGVPVGELPDVNDHDE